MYKIKNRGLPTQLVGPLPTYAKQTTTKSTLRGKKIVEVPESVGLTRKPEQVYGLILEDDDDDDEVTSNKHFSTSYKRLLYAKQLPLYLDIPEHLK